MDQRSILQICHTSLKLEHLIFQENFEIQIEIKSEGGARDYGIDQIVGSRKTIYWKI